MVRAKFGCSFEAWEPRAVHIAYRRKISPVTMWRFYGTVLCIDNELRLYSESGAFQTMPQVEADEIRFRTYFVGCEVELRTASLNEFTVDTTVPHNDTSTVGFEW